MKPANLEQLLKSMLVLWRSAEADGIIDLCVMYQNSCRAICDENAKARIKRALNGR